MQLNEFYKRVLQMGIMEADDKGVIRLLQEHKPAVMLGDRILVLPTTEQINNLNENKEVFHPLAEDTIAGLSNVSKKLLERINFSLNVTFTQMMTYLHSLATSSTGKTNYSSAQLEILQSIRTQPKKELDIMKVLGDRFVKNPTNAFVEITLSRSGKTLYRGERVSRIAFTTFPFYNELKKDLEKARKDSTLHLSVEQVEFIIELYEAIFPNLDLQDEYNAGVGVVYAPFFTVLMKSAGMLFQAMMRLKAAFPDFIELTEQIETDFSWLAILDNQDQLRKLANQLPNLEINKNPVEKGNVSSSVPQSVPEPPRPTAQSQYVPEQRQPTAPASTPQEKKEQSYEEWASGRVGMSQMGVYGMQKEAMRRHNEGYRAYWNQHISSYGAPPVNMPHPDNIPAGQMAPQYPTATPVMMPQMMPQQGMVPMGQVPMVMMPNGTMVPQNMAPQQTAQPTYAYQPQPAAYGQPAVYGQPVAYGQTVSYGGYPQQPQMGYGQYPNPLSAAGGYRR